MTLAVAAGSWPALAETGGLQAGCKGAQSLEFVQTARPSDPLFAFRG